MELQFEKQELTCLEKVLSQVQDQELTQEQKLEESMPDIAKVLGAWGQVVLRSKEWQGNGLAISGGVMVWVLYAPEGQEPCQCVESWVPFQMKWDFPEVKRDGNILVLPLLRSIDARSTSVRKLMVRMDVSVLAEATVPGNCAVYGPPQLPRDICLLKKSYPMMIPVEAGEKSFLLEDTLNFGPSNVQPEMVVHYGIRPEILDQKVLGDKVVFRGIAVVHMLYRGEDGGMYKFHQEIPFSHFADLDHEYIDGASARVIPVVTAMELEKNEAGQYKVKAGAAGQYMVLDRALVDVVEDAYSPARSVIPQTQSLQLPVILEQDVQTIRAEQSISYAGGKVVDVVFYPEHPMILRDQGGVRAQLGGGFQVLHYGDQGMLDGTHVSWSDEQQIPASETVRMEMIAQTSGNPAASSAAGDLNLQSDLLLQSLSYSMQGIPMVTGLDVAQEAQLDPERPSLILQRYQAESLWELAKSNGSTVESICQANGLESEPMPGQMLLIPVQ